MPPKVSNCPYSIGGGTSPPSPPPHELPPPLSNRGKKKQVNVQPDFAAVFGHLSKTRETGSASAPNIVPLFAQIPAEFLNPASAYLKLSAK